jgi:diguanylate cyclase (GGDEF)-like protein
LISAESQGICTHTMVTMLAKIDSGTVLLMGAALLACGSASLLLVRLSNPRLRGLGWLGCAFLSGGVGAMLIASPISSFYFASFLVSDFLILLAMALLHAGVLEMQQAPSLIDKASVTLLAIQAFVSTALYLLFPVAIGHLHIALLGVLIGCQLLLTVWMLIGLGKREVRAPAWLMSTLLISLIVINIFRSGVIFLADGVRYAQQLAALSAFTYMMYIVTAMGLAFGFFWMTSVELTTELEQLANTDPLTRIYNRRIFRRWCEREMAMSHQRSGTFSMLMIDLDHFKQVNDRYGHQFGDVVLCASVERMQDAVRGIDVLGRWGGEEFMVMLPGATAESALLVAERVRMNIERLRVPLAQSAQRQVDEVVVSVTVSLGVTTYTGVSDDLEAMFHRTDVALYRAKSGGRNRVVALWTNIDDRATAEDEDARLVVERRSFYSA